jgi:hypothetical protein
VGTRDDTCLLTGRQQCASEACRRGAVACPSAATWARIEARREAVNAAALRRHIEWKNETRNLFDLLLAKGSITVAHRAPPSLWRRFVLAFL